MNDGAQVAFFGGDEREACGEVVPAENRQGAGAGAIVFSGAVLEHVAHQVEVGFHREVSLGFAGAAWTA